MPTTRQRLEGGLLGLLVGDALGVPYEFHDPEDIPPWDQIEYVPPSGFVRAHRGTPPGTWSDDGAQALCLLASLLECGRLDPEDLGQRFLRWYGEGYLAVDGRVFDIGIQTSKALRTLRGGGRAVEAGPASEEENGNGSLMRVLPLALWHKGSDIELADDAQTQSRITHGHLRSQVCCALYCLWARRALEGLPDPWKEATDALRRVYASNPEARTELEEAVRPDELSPGKGTGYVVDSLHSARHALAAGPYEVAVKTAIALGNDTDTTAALAGGMAGIRDGVDAIPSRWLSQLRGQDLCRPLLEGLLAHGL